MSTSAFQTKKFTLPWRGSRKAKAGMPDTNHDRAAASILQESDRETTQISHLDTLPLEIQHKIFSYLATPWTMAVMSPAPQYETPPDPTLNMILVDNRLISGPPEASLLLVCRTLYYNFLPFYGSNCTGTLILGKVKSSFRRKLPQFLSSHFKLRRFYHKIHTVNVAFTLDYWRLGLNFRKLFPNLKRAECVVHEGSYGPFLRPSDSIDRFIYGRYDQELLEWTRPTVNHFIGLDGGSVEQVYKTSCPWDDKEAVVDVKVLGTTAKNSKCVLGYNYRWEGSRVVVISRVIRTGSDFRIWEPPSAHSSGVPNMWQHYDMVPRFRWVQDLKW